MPIWSLPMYRTPPMGTWSLRRSPVSPPAAGAGVTSAMRICFSAVWADAGRGAADGIIKKAATKRVRGIAQRDERRLGIVCSRGKELFRIGVLGVLYTNF